MTGSSRWSRSNASPNSAVWSKRRRVGGFRFPPSMAEYNPKLRGARDVDMFNAKHIQ
jgi:hypothetical protein